jgi:multidrug transporter EmrE-like cation transporter
MNKAAYYLPLVFACVACNTLAQISLKAGLREIGYIDFNIVKVINTSFQLLKSPFILVGFIAYALSLIFWIACLSRVEVSFAYPLTSLGYVFTAFIGFMLFQEDLNSVRLLGIIIIMVGVYIVSIS